MCLGVARCVHHIDPAVQWLERDYDHMYEEVQAPMEGGLNSTVLMDRRTGDDFYNFDGDDFYWSGDSTEAPQPMFTIKHDYHDWHDMALMPCSWRWNVSEGPILPNESLTPAENDELRDEEYQGFLLLYMRHNGIEPTNDLVAAVARRRAEAEERLARLRRAREAEQRGPSPSHVIVDEVHEFEHDTLELLRETIMAATEGVEVYTTTAETSPALDAAGFVLPEQRRFFENASQDPEDKSQGSMGA